MGQLKNNGWMDIELKHIVTVINNILFFVKSHLLIQNRCTPLMLLTSVHIRDKYVAFEMALSHSQIPPALLFSFCCWAEAVQRCHIVFTTKAKIALALPISYLEMSCCACVDNWLPNLASGTCQPFYSYNVKDFDRFNNIHVRSFDLLQSFICSDESCGISLLVFVRPNLDPPLVLGRNSYHYTVLCICTVSLLEESWYWTWDGLVFWPRVEELKW